MRYEKPVLMHLNERAVSGQTRSCFDGTYPDTQGGYGVCSTGTGPTQSFWPDCTTGRGATGSGTGYYLCNAGGSAAHWCDSGGSPAYPHPDNCTAGPSNV